MPKIKIKGKPRRDAIQKPSPKKCKAPDAGKNGEEFLTKSVSDRISGAVNALKKAQSDMLSPARALQEQAGTLFGIAVEELKPTWCFTSPSALQNGISSFEAMAATLRPMEDAECERLLPLLHGRAIVELLCRLHAAPESPLYRVEQWMHQMDAAIATSTNLSVQASQETDREAPGPTVGGIRLLGSRMQALVSQFGHIQFAMDAQKVTLEAVEKSVCRQELFIQHQSKKVHHASPHPHVYIEEERQADLVRQIRDVVASKPTLPTASNESSPELAKKAEQSRRWDLVRQILIYDEVKTTSEMLSTLHSQTRQTLRDLREAIDAAKSRNGDDEDTGQRKKRKT